ncbi:phosphate signaling complex PhoU family protein [Methanohalophilus levihalophilus]|uniref:phosphate signaling complex PhoU family protein n=1 Tax=Methanohalophilus levihalophilus TaxID=1431282 RepID=UPI001AEB76A1|nr:phosphate uptake regulator PhoU [Methanohalophilus levihalophilus]
MAEKRKIQLTGGSTYIVSLPIKWVRNTGMSVGDTVNLIPQSDNSLLISSDLLSEEKQFKASIEVPENSDPEDTFRILVSYYLVGFDLITLQSNKGFSASERKFIKDASRKRLIGLEVVEENKHDLVLQSLLNYRDLSLHKAIGSMEGLLTSMLEDVMEALKTGDFEIAKDVLQRDNEVDRFYLLTVRQIKGAIEDRNLSEKLGISRPRECLGYRLVVKNLERIGDHMVRITNKALELDEPLPKDHFIFSLSNDVSHVFKSSMTSLELVDTKRANATIKMSQKISNRILSEKKEIEPRIASISESLRRIAEYSADIAEISINMGTKELHS